MEQYSIHTFHSPLKSHYRPVGHHIHHMTSSTDLTSLNSRMVTCAQSYRHPYTQFSCSKYSVPVSHTNINFNSTAQRQALLRSKSNKIFENRERQRLLSPYRNPVRPNLKIINYGPIQLICNSRAAPKNKQNIYESNLLNSKSIYRSGAFPHLRRCVQLGKQYDMYGNDYRQQQSSDQQTVQIVLKNRQNKGIKKNPLQYSYQTFINLNSTQTHNNSTILDPNGNTSASNKFINLVKQNIILDSSNCRPRSCIKLNSMSKIQTNNNINNSIQSRNSTNVIDTISRISAIDRKQCMVWTACVICCIIILTLLVIK